MKEKDPQEYFEKELAKRQLQQMDQQIAIGNSQMMDQHQLSDVESVSLVKEQLDLGKDIERIDKLLRGWTLVQTQQGEKWEEPKNEDLIILSEQGIHYFRQILANYVHKGTMLSHYEQDDILQKMHDLANQINDDIFISYETLFKMPSVKRCTKELKKRIENKSEVKKFARELLGQPVNETEIKSQVMKEMEINLEIELTKIKDKLFNDKLKRFSSYLLWIEDLIHSTYQRAYNGAERRTLRQHMQITETTGAVGIPEQKGGMLQWRKN
jgi:hypothetical protein